MPTQRKPTPRKAAYKATELPSTRVESDRRIPLIILAIIAALMALVLIFTRCSAPSANNDNPSPGEPAVVTASSSAASASSSSSSASNEPRNPDAKATFAEYSWSELKEIADKIAKTSSDAEAIEIATMYNLVDADGKINPSSVKSVSLNDGSTADVRIIGFNHDTTSDGKGKAGITFMFTDGIGYSSMNDDGTSLGGWANSYGTYFVGIELWGLIPDEVANNIVEVSKSSNTAEEGSVDESGDVFWLPAYTEIAGPASGDGASTLTMEGSQYKFFADAGITASANNGVLVMQYNGQANAWWLRSANPAQENKWYYVNDSGHIDAGGSPEQTHALVPCFCF